MDTSKEYCKMCNCPEIQDQKSMIYSDCEFYDGYLYGEDKDIVHLWLPRQDQLQDMLGVLSWNLHYGHPGRMGDYVATAEVLPGQKETHCSAETPEQALLLMLMLELHGKKWNGEEWVK